jgi:membrane associated rhomboid family serine protease
MRRNHNQNVGAALLVTVINYLQRLDFVPYVTLATLALLYYLHLNTFQRTIGDLAISAEKVLGRRGFFDNLMGFSSGRYSWWEVGIASQLLHLDDLHLYYNSLSFLHKGAQLERPTSRGAVGLAALLAVLTVLTPIFYVGLAVAGSSFMPGLYRQQAVGFSGVIFALKVVCQTSSAGSEVVGGVQVPAKLAAWAELVLIQLISPNASFMGHLAGILAGLAVVAAERALLARRGARR